MEIYNTLGWVLIALPPLVCLFLGDFEYMLDIRPILAILWGMFLVWRF